MVTDRNENDPTRVPQAEVKHPAEWQADLNPDHMAGQNVGGRADMERGLPNAYDVKDVHRTLSNQFEDDELRQIPVLPRGERLEQGGTYLDLRDPERREFTARGDMAADGDHWYVPKEAVPYSLWNRLTGVTNPERIAERRSDRLDG